jgi:hypothetical protein
MKSLSSLLDEGVCTIIVVRVDFAKPDVCNRKPWNPIFPMYFSIASDVLTSARLMLAHTRAGACGKRSMHGEVTYMPRFSIATLLYA